MRIFPWALFPTASIWSAIQLYLFLRSVSISSLVNSSITAAEFLAIFYGVIVLFALIVLFRIAQIWQASRSWKNVIQIIQYFGKKEVVLLSTVAFLPQQSVQSVPSAETNSVPIRSVCEPAVALALVKRLLRRRKESISEVDVTTRMTEESAMRTYELRQYAVESLSKGIRPSDSSEKELDRQLGELFDIEQAPWNVTQSWDFVVRMYGYPFVENRDGIRAQFGKRRSIEVLAWLGMNLDRPRRSAVRTALWDVEISDSSFSTVMSDIRRGLSSIASECERQEILPPTFTDRIEIGVKLVTDFDLLHDALKKFRDDPENASLLAFELEQIRDVPFAGANYMWADLDGTTTRMVVLALQASCELAQWARQVNDVDMCSVAVKAGLRVMPGHNELLAIQHSFISQRSMSQG